MHLSYITICSALLAVVPGTLAAPTHKLESQLEARNEDQYSLVMRSENPMLGETIMGLSKREPLPSLLSTVLKTTEKLVPKKLPDIPVKKASELLKKTPKLPKKLPSIPHVKTPKVPHVKTPKVPHVKTPKTPKVKTPKTPKTPKVKTPKTTKTPKVKTPKTPKSKTNKVSKNQHKTKKNTNQHKTKKNTNQHKTKKNNNLHKNKKNNNQHKTKKNTNRRPNQNTSRKPNRRPNQNTNRKPNRHSNTNTNRRPGQNTNRKPNRHSNTNTNRRPGQNTSRKPNRHSNTNTNRRPGQNTSRKPNRNSNVNKPKNNRKPKNSENPKSNSNKANRHCKRSGQGGSCELDLGGGNNNGGGGNDKKRPRPGSNQPSRSDIHKDKQKKADEETQERQELVPELVNQLPMFDPNEPVDIGTQAPPGRLNEENFDSVGKLWQTPDGWTERNSRGALDKARQEYETDKRAQGRSGNSLTVATIPKPAHGKCQGAMCITSNEKRKTPGVAPKHNPTETAMLQRNKEIKEGNAQPEPGNIGMQERKGTEARDSERVADDTMNTVLTPQQDPNQQVPEGSSFYSYNTAKQHEHASCGPSGQNCAEYSGRRGYYPGYGEYAPSKLSNHNKFDKGALKKQGQLKAEEMEEQGLSENPAVTDPDRGFITKDGRPANQKRSILLRKAIHRRALNNFLLQERSLASGMDEPSFSAGQFSTRDVLHPSASGVLAY